MDVRGGQFRHTGCGCQPNTVGVILSYQSAGINTSCMECLPRLVSISTKSSLESLGTCFWSMNLASKVFKKPSRKIPFVPNSSFFNTLLNWSGLTVIGIQLGGKNGATTGSSERFGMISRGFMVFFAIKILYSDSREGFERGGPVLVMIRRLCMIRPFVAEF